MDHKVAVVGTGFIGRAWAIAFARAGCRVALYNTQTDAAEAALTFIDGILSDLAANDLLRGQAPEQLRQRIHTSRDIETALKGAKHVQENAPEQLGPQDRALPDVGCARRTRRGDREFDLGFAALPLHRGTAGTWTLPRRASHQSALSRSGCRNRAGALDRSRRSSRKRRNSCEASANRRSSCVENSTDS